MPERVPTCGHPDGRLPLAWSLLEIVDVINTNLAGHVDFCVLPGDNADDGTDDQYRLVRELLTHLTVPVHILPGDHDRKQGSLRAFYDVLGAAPLPFSISRSGHRCLFLDIVSAGGAGPDFRIGAEQLSWLERQLDSARRSGEMSVLFMHAYPADLKEDGAALLSLIHDHEIRVVDMGHTHYNELTNDGRTVYATTRSTGQTEEGPVGFSLMTLNRGVVSWRFKPLHSLWPFVMITSPADHRLAAGPDHQSSGDSRSPEVTASAWSAAGVSECRCRVDDGEWQMMAAKPDRSRWTCLRALPQRQFKLGVEARDRAGNTDIDSIRVAQNDERRPTPVGDGSDADRIGAWPERHLLGTQLGPNRNGRHW